MLASKLKELGFSDKEIKIYLTLLEFGPSTAQQLSQKKQELTGQLLTYSLFFASFFTFLKKSGSAPEFRH